MEISLLNASVNSSFGAKDIAEAKNIASGMDFEKSGNLSFAQVMAGLESKVDVLPVGSTFSSALNGDYLSSFKLENPTPADRAAEPQGMARGFYGESGAEGLRTIDKTSVLYEKALELESYFVKIMTESMRSTLSGASIAGDESFASKMYKDMMYDELNRNLTKHAGFGLADQIYLQLNH